MTRPDSLTAELLELVLGRLLRIATLAVEAALTGDRMKVEAILPDPADYPDEKVYREIERRADERYGR